MTDFLKLCGLIFVGFFVVAFYAIEQSRRKLPCALYGNKAFDWTDFNNDPANSAKIERYRRRLIEQGLPLRRLASWIPPEARR